MFERYTEAARRTLFSARYMAGQTGSSCIESEHLLLGILVTDKGLAQRFLGSPWAAEEVWKKIELAKAVGEPSPAPGDIPLSNENKRALAYGAEEAFRLSHKHIGSEHLLLGLMREEKSFGAEILRERGLRLETMRKQLKRTPHKESVRDEFHREIGPRPAEIVEVQKRIADIRTRMAEALAKRDLAGASACSDEERPEIQKLHLLCRQYGLADWIWG